MRLIGHVDPQVRAFANLLLVWIDRWHLHPSHDLINLKLCMVHGHQPAVYR